MFSRRTAAILAAAVCSIGSLARANDLAPAQQQSAIDTPRYLAEVPPHGKPLMDLLRGAGIGKTLDQLNINIYGHIEGSYTYNAAAPESGVNAGRVFDLYHNEPVMNQAAIKIERTVDLAKKQFDIGGKIDFMYGTDARFIHSNGLFDWYDAPKRIDEPEYEMDLTQAYVDFAIPVGNGLLIRAGKFVTPFGQEVIDPTGNALFSHGYLFNFAIPFTHTGILGTYNLSDEFAISAGVARGWGQSTEDNNDAVEFLGGFKWVLSKQTTAIVNLSVGPQRTDNNDDYRSVVELLLNHNVSDELSVALEADYGWDNDGAADGSNAEWYGLAFYTSYKINSYFTFNTRTEWLCDADGFATGVDANFFDLTLGLAIKPMPNDRWGQYLTIRPEIRLDLADEDVFDDGDDQSMVTFGVDAIYAF